MTLFRLRREAWRLLLVSLPLFPSLALCQEIDFNHALNLAKARSLELGQRSSEVRQSNVQLENHVGHYLPTLEGSVRTGRDGESFSALPQTNYQAASLDLRWNIYRFGGDALHGEKLALDQKAAELNKAASELEVEKKLALTLLEYIRLQKELEIENRVEATRKNGLDIVKKLFAQGLRSKQDVKKIELDVARESIRRDQAFQQVAGAKESVAALIGTASILQSAWPWERALAKRTENSIKKITDILDHPESKVGQSSLAAAELAIRESRKGYYPTLDAVASLGWQDREGISAQEKIGAALVLTVPLIDGLNTRTNVAIATERYTLTQEQLQSLENELPTRRNRALLVFTTAEHSFQEYSKLLGTTLEIYKDSLESFRRGMLSANDLDADLGRVLDGENLIARSLWDWHSSLIDLCHAHGMLLDKCLTILEKI